jgi:predicted nucleotidyltransferase
MTLLEERAARQAEQREAARLATRRRLRNALAEICPGETVFVFGSITRPGRFFQRSDVDVALERLPQVLSHYGFMGLLEEKVGRPVDVLLLAETRLREKILAEAERWIA